MVFNPRSTKATAVSSPIKPAPITTADLAVFMALSIFSPSSRVRTAYTPCFSCPFIGGIKGEAPVAMIRLSYSSFSFFPVLS